MKTLLAICLAVLLAGCQHGSYRDNGSYDDPYLHTPIDNDIYN